MRDGRDQGAKLNFTKLIASYNQSPIWERLTPQVKTEYSKNLEFLPDTIGNKTPTKMRLSSVIAAQMVNRHRARFADSIP